MRNGPRRAGTSGRPASTASTAAVSATDQASGPTRSRLGREGHDTVERDEPGAGRHADDAALRSRLADRPTRVGADREGGEPGGDRRRAAAAAAAGAAPQVPRVGGRAERRGPRRGAHRQLVHVGASDEHRTGRAQPGHHRGVVQGHDLARGGRAAGGGLPLDVDVVLDDERARRPAGPDRLAAEPGQVDARARRRERARRPPGRRRAPRARSRRCGAGRPAPPPRRTPHRGPPAARAGRHRDRPGPVRSASATRRQGQPTA